MTRASPGMAALGSSVLALACLWAPVSAQSLYNAQTFQSLTADRRAHRVGDVVTVLVQETASASSSTDTAIGHTNGAHAQLDSPFNTQIIVGSRRGAFGTGTNFDGSGQTQRNGRLLAQLTLTVKEVLPNGLLVVTGEQSLEINNERQRIRVEGRARPEDIGDANTILSFRLADARISYQGSGDLSKDQRPSWWVRLLRAFGF